MKKIVTALCAATAFVAFAAPAEAANLTGGRVELVVGWDHPSIDLGDFGVDDSLDEDGIVFGIGGGYDFAVGSSTSLGIDLEVTESTASFDFDDGVDTVEISAGRDLYVGGRVTFAAGSNANFYLKAGYTNARLSFDVNGTEDSANGDGIRAGAGAQFAIGTNAYIGGEYRYSNYEADISRHQVVAVLGFRI